MKVTVKVYVHSALDYDKQPLYRAASYGQNDWCDTTCVAEMDVEVELPAAFDPVLTEIHRLQAAKCKIEQKAYETGQNIQQQINELQCLTWTGEEVV